MQAPTVLLVLSLLTLQSTAVPIGNFYSYGTDTEDMTLQIGQAASSELQLINQFRFYGTQHSSIHVNSNGVISLGQALSSSLSMPEAFPSNKTVIAPFWTNYDNLSPTKLGQVYYRASNARDDLTKANADIQTAFRGSFSFSSIAIVTWENMHQVGDSTETNTFQCVLAMSEFQSYVIVRYASERMQWAGAPYAQVGINAGDGMNYLTVPTSNTDRVLDIPNTGNSGRDGLWVWRVHTAEAELPGVVIGWDRLDYSVGEQDGNLQVCISIDSGILSASVVVTAATELGTAVPNGDFLTRTDYQFTFSVGQSNHACTTIYFNNDDVLEDEEYFNLILQPVSNSGQYVAVLPQKSRIHIQDDETAVVTHQEPLVTVSEDSATVSVCGALKDNNNEVMMSERLVRVAFSTRPGTALNNIDFTPVTNGEMVFPPGVSSICATIEILDDDIFENDEMFYYSFSEVTPLDRITVDSSTMGTVMIKDEDGPKVSVSFDQSSYTVAEGEDFTTCVQMTAGQLGGSFNVTFQTRYPAELIQGSVVPARKVDDYVGIFEILNFNPSNSQERKCFTISTTEDRLYEGEEIFGVVLSTKEDIIFPMPRVTVHLTDNDEVEISLIQSRFEFHEGQDSSSIRICANRTGEIQRPLIVSVTPQLETASFYDQRTQTGDVIRDISDINFFTGDYNACTRITILDDYVLEDPVETFNVWLAHHDSAIMFPVDTATILIHDNDHVSISFFRDPDTEVDEDATVVPTVCIQRQGLIDIPVPVSLEPVSGTATVSEDYNATGKMIIFNPNRNQLAVDCPTISLTLYDDPIVEGDEEVMLQLMSSDDPARVIVTDSNGLPRTAILRIKENDEVYASFTKQVFSVSEGDGGVDVCLVVRGFSIQPFTVFVSTWADTAQEGIDFLPQNVAIHFPPTDPEIISNLYQLAPPQRLATPLPISEPQCARISIIDDQVLEAVSSKILVLNIQENETYVQLEDPHSAIITIFDDDFVAVVLETNELSVSEGVGTVRVCANLIGMADFDIHAQLQTSPVSATAAVDYITNTATLRFPAHSVESQCTEFSVIDDNVLESPEAFLIELSITEVNSPIVAGVNRSMSVTIVDNDFVEVEFQERDYSPEESDSTLTVCAEMRGRTDREVSVLFSTRPSQEGVLAMADVDYTAITNVTFFDGVLHDALRTQCINITINEDLILEDTESFQVSLTSLDSGVRVTEMGVANIYVLDDDGVRMGIQEREYEVAETQNKLSVCVELIGRIEKSINIALSTSPLSATADADYTGVRSMSHMFQAADLNEQILCADFSILDDTIYEETESFAISLSIDDSTTGVSVHIPRATVFIKDNDAVTVGVQSETYEVNEGDGQVEVCFVMNERSEIEVSCSVRTEPVSAVQDGEDGHIDYSFSDSLSLVFPPSMAGGLQCTFVNITDDQILESMEQFRVIVSSEMPRVIVNPNTSIVDIIDNDRVIVGFVEVMFNVSEDLEDERNITVCVQLVGEIEKNVHVTLATATSTGAVALANEDDYIPLETELIFTPEQDIKTHCVTVSVLDDRSVEAEETFNIVLTTDNEGVILPEARKIATVVISDKDVVCEREGTDTSRGFFDWPQAFPNEVVRVPCVNGTTVRKCNSKGVWGSPDVDNCYASIDAIFKHIFIRLPTDNGGLSKEALRELIEALLRLKETNPEGLSKFIGAIANIFERYSMNVDNDVVAVDPEVFELILVVVDILHFPEWPKYIVQEESIRFIKAVELISVGLFKIDGFKRLDLNNTFLGFSAEKGSVDQVLPLGDQFKTIVFERHPTKGTVSRLSSQNSDETRGDILSSITLPSSIVEQLQLNEDSVGLYFAFYETSVMFPLASNSTDLSVTQSSHVVSPVVMATVSKTPIQNLKDMVNYTISIDRRVNYTNPVCVSWDFSAVGGRGNWTTEGCKLKGDNDGVITCSCSHLTNFAVLLDVRTRVPTGPVITPKDNILSTILIIGVGISLLGLVLTVITLLLFNKLRKRDSTVLRIQLCISLALMLLAFVCGIERVEIFELCVTISALIHYFTLVSMMWMAAEALLMFQKLIVMFTKTSVAYFVIVSIICWLLPIPAVVVPIGIDRNFSIHESYCFISHHIVFYAAFLGPIFAILVFNIIIFFMAFIIVLRHSANRFKNTEKAKKRRAAVRNIFTILCIMAIFGLTWVFGAFTVQGFPDYFEYLFVIFNSLQGLIIFLVFVVFAKETRDLWLQTCGCKKKKPEEEVVETANISRVPSLRKGQRPSLGSIGSFDYDGADRLEALKAFDREARLNMNSWDVMYVMPQNTFDIFLNSEQFLQEPDFSKVRDDSQPQITALPAPGTDINIREDQSVADSGIIVDQSKASRSPRRLAGDSIEESPKRNSHHIHSVSGIGYVSAESSDEDYLQERVSPVLSTPPSKRRSRVIGDRFKKELQNGISTHEHDTELGIVTSDVRINVS